MYETYDADARPGDIIRGGDGNVWQIAEMDRESPRGFSVTLVRDGYRVTGWPPLGTEVEILQRAEVPHGADAEVSALQALAALGPVSLVREAWTQ
jgi:hypothetical protein